MTITEIRKRTNEKVGEIKALCDKLQITLSAEQMIVENNIIRNVVYYIDAENYPKDEPIIVAPSEDAGLKPNPDAI